MYILRRELGRIGLVSCGLGAALGGTVAVRAQEAPPQLAEAAAAAAPQSAGIEEVVVQARRKSENQQDVPVSVRALTSDALDRMSVQTTADIQFHVPGLDINNGAYFLNAEPTFVMRGLLSTSPGGSIADPDVVTYFAGVPQMNNRAISNATFDLDSIQVLAGPQGTLFGKNSPGGAILFEPAHPTDQFEGSVTAEVGDYDLWKVTPMLNVPLGDAAAVRVAGQIARRGAFTENLAGSNFDDLHYEAGRIGLNLKPFDELESYTVVDGYESRAHGTALISSAIGGIAPCFYGIGAPFAFDPACTPYLGAPVSGIFENPSLGSITAAFARQQALGIRTVYSPDVDVIGGVPVYSPGNLLSIYTYDINNTTQYHLSDNITFKNIVSYSHQTDQFNENSTSLVYPLLQVYDAEHMHQVSEEFQVLGKAFDGKLDWIAGTYYSDQSLFDRDQSAILTPAIADVLVSENTAQSNAVFAQGTYNLGAVLDGLDFTGGYRYTWDQKAETTLSTGNGVCRLFIPNPDGSPSTVNYPGCERTVSGIFQAPNWTVGLDYHVTDTVMLYVASRRGFRSGGFNATATEPGYEKYTPEKLTDVEAGIKADWKLGDIPIRTNLSIYRSEFDGATVAPVVTYRGGQDQLILNTVGAVIRGGEFEFAVKPIPQFQLSGSYSLVVGAYDQGSGEPLSFLDNGQPNMARVQGCFGGPTTTFVDLSGCNLLGSSKHTVNLSAQYNLPIPEDWGGLLYEVDYSWRSPQSLPQGFLNAYGIVNMRLEWAGIFGHPIDAALWVKNLGDKDYLTNQQQFLAAFGVNQQQYGNPRTFGFDLTYRFGGGGAPSPEVAPPPLPPVAAPPVPPAHVEAQRQFQVFFDFDKSNITEAAAQVIRAAADAAKAGNVVHLTVTGHTDTVGTAAYNLALSQRRAASVKAELVRDGLAGDEIATVGVGKTGLLVPTVDGVREPQNRRAVIEFQ